MSDTQTRFTPMTPELLAAFQSARQIAEERAGAGDYLLSWCPRCGEG